MNESKDESNYTYIDMKNHYEIEYINFFINVLEPFIRFKKNHSVSSNESYITIIYKDKTKENSEEDNSDEGIVEKEINIKEFIFFLQISFPKYLNNEVNQINKLLNKESLDKKIFEKFLKLGLDDFKEFYNKEENKEEKNGMYESIIKMNKEDIDKMTKFYRDEKGYKEITKIMTSKLNYLKRLLDFNREKHSKIEDILNLVKNIEYLI